MSKHLAGWIQSRDELCSEVPATIPRSTLEINCSLVAKCTTRDVSSTFNWEDKRAYTPSRRHRKTVNLQFISRISGHMRHFSWMSENHYDKPSTISIRVRFQAIMKTMLQDSKSIKKICSTSYIMAKITYWVYSEIWTTYNDWNPIMRSIPSSQ